jgi:katanin p80 WD40 repeat-containing subunit B1
MTLTLDCAIASDQFHAHQESQEAINCAVIGSKSLQVLATGSNDKTVQVFRIGEATPLLNIPGFGTEVDSLLFDSEEENVLAAGTRGGTVKLLDLSSNKAIRNLTGHRSSVTSLDFLPYGSFLTSGSRDTNIKVWDIRKKNCLQTYRDHHKPITVVKHSPDGKWIISGDSDGHVKIWDLAAGKQLEEFKVRPGKLGVTSLDFHPSEVLMAVGSGANTVSFWELETFECVSITSNQSSEPRHVMFRYTLND